VRSVPTGTSELGVALSSNISQDFGTLEILRLPALSKESRAGLLSVKKVLPRQISNVIRSLQLLRKFLKKKRIRIQHRLPFITQRVQFLSLLVCPLSRQVASLVKGVKQRVNRPEANGDAKVLGVRLLDAVSCVVAFLDQVE